MSLWTVMRYMGSDRYEIVGHRVQAESRGEAALRIFERTRKRDDAELWTLMVLSEDERAGAGVTVGLKAEVRNG